MNRTESIDFAKMRQEQIEREESVVRGYEESFTRVQNQLQKLSAMLSRQYDSAPASKDYSSVVRGYEESFTRVQNQLQKLSDMLSRQYDSAPTSKDYSSVVRGYEESFTRVQNQLQKLSAMFSRQSDFAPASKYDPDQPRDDLGRFALIGTNNPDDDDSPDQGNIDDNAPGQIIPVSTNKPDKKPPLAKGELRIDDAVKYLKKHALPESDGKCAIYVRKAIEKGGVIVLDKDKNGKYINSAKGYYDRLEAYFERVKPDSLEDYSPQKGDIVVFLSPDKKHEHGHIQMYSWDEGNKKGQWISDYVQPDFFPHSAYKKFKPGKGIAIYRPKDPKPPATEI